MKLDAKKIIHLVVIVVVLAALIVGNTFAYKYDGVITNALIPTDTSLSAGEESDAILQAQDELVQELQAESSVLLQNDGTLPLSFTEDGTNNINLIGWGSSDNGFSLSGTGSGTTSASGEETELVEAFEEYGYTVNMDLQDYYNSYSGAREIAFGKTATMELAEPSMDEYNSYDSSLLSDAINFSDTAVMVITRVAGENMGEISSTTQTFTDNTKDTTRGTLELAEQEEALIDWMVANFDNTVVLLNNCNTMHLGKLATAGVGAVMYIGQTGQSGTLSIPKLLTGEINPSGKLVDTYVYDKTTDSTYANSVKASNNIVYVEDIYFGYKWYETADVEGFWDDIDNEYGTGYDGVVQYPFGHGLSYTTFSQEIVEINDDVTDPADLQGDDVIEITVLVTNEGDVAGKDIVQLYNTPPYYTGQIEKAHVNLLTFEKTAELDPGQSQYVTLEIDAYDLASYDCYDKNLNNFMGYELEQGSYEIKVMQDAHTTIDSVTYTVTSDIKIEYDIATGEKVENQWTGDSAYAGTPIDASTVGNITYLSRAGFKGTFPTEQAETPTGYSSATTYRYDGWDDADYPTTESTDTEYLFVTYEDGSKISQDVLDGKADAEQDVIYNEELIQEIGNDYDNAIWQDMVEQMSISEMTNWVECSGFGVSAVASVGKSAGVDYDGPSGFNTVVTTTDGGTATRTAFPNENLIACSWNTAMLFAQGRSQGAEASACGITGWYAPCVNLHRSNYSARNFEAYSEDGVISGMMASELIRGAKTNNLMCYLKHLALSEPGQNPTNLNTWLTEQNFRENYLRAFEIPVKDGSANAIMSAFNRIGCVWAGSNYPLLTTVLRGEWGFEGVVLTDWSTGGTDMYPPRGVLAGNDIWLNSNSTNNYPLSTSSNAEMAAAQQAAKNVLYAAFNTYYGYMNYDADADDKYNATVGVVIKDAQFVWWIPLLVAIDVVVVAGMGFYGYMCVFRKKKDQK